MTPAQDRQPLFVTRFDLSAKSAIGVQTRRLMAPFAAAQHIFWDRRDMIPADPRSRSIEALLPSRLSVFKRPGRLSRLMQAAGVTHWRGMDFSPGVAVQLKALGKVTSVIYLAPIGADDALRMRRIVELVDRPFVVHLWDALDREPAEDADLRWLLTHADIVYGLTQPLLTASNRADAELLLFSRAATAVEARVPISGSRLRIATMGDVVSYQDGLTVLIEACERLKTSGLTTELIYIGSAGTARRLPAGIRGRLVKTGFLASDQRRDEVLAGCHLGFMPGPSAPPEQDLRSRFSVPSRMLDFISVGLPIIGTVHPRSATYAMAEWFGIATGLCQDSDGLMQVIKALADPGSWNAAAKRSRSAFAEFLALDPPNQLARDLRSIGERQSA